MKAKVLKCSTAEFWRDNSYAERGAPEILRVSFTYSAREKLLEARKKTIWKEQREQSRELIQGLEKLVFLQSKKPHILWVIGYALVARYCFRSRGNSPRLVLLYFQIINFKSIPRKKSKLLSSVQSSCSVVSNSFGSVLSLVAPCILMLYYQWHRSFKSSCSPVEFTLSVEFSSVA